MGDNDSKRFLDTEAVLFLFYADTLLPELASVLDSPPLLDCCLTAFAGMTIKFPSAAEMGKHRTCLDAARLVARLEAGAIDETEFGVGARSLGMTEAGALRAAMQVRQKVSNSGNTKKQETQK